MVYDSEVILPTEMQYGSSRVQAYQLIEVEQARQDAIDLLKGSRDIVVVWSAMYQQNLWRYHVWRVQPRAFQVGDLILC
jgi:hypothetical protein